MADGMSFDRYIDNPSGGAVFTNRNMYKAMYKAKFDTILVREQGHIDFKVFKSEDAQDAYYIYMKIPSEVISNFYYDVVVKLYTNDNAKKNGAVLRNYAAQFFSNDPAFVYTFAHTFVVNHLFVEELKTKMIKRAYKENATVKNPKNNVWYVKSLYFAYLTMEKYGLFHRSMLNQHSQKYRKNDLLQLITPSDVKINNRQREQEKLDAQKRKEKEDARRARQQPRNVNVSTDKAKSSPVSRVTKSVSKVPSTRSVRSTKTTTMRKKTNNH